MRRMRWIPGVVAIGLLSVAAVTEAQAWEREMSCYKGQDCPAGQEPMPTYWDSPCITFHLNEAGTKQMKFSDVESAVKNSVAA